MWTPSNMGAELMQWLKADAITGLADTNPVATWLDSSPNARNMSASGATRPQYLVSNINGFSAVNFDGVDDRMSSSSYTLSGQRATMVIVCKLDTLRDYNPVAQVHSTSTPTYTGRVLWVTCYSNGSLYAGSNNYIYYAASSISTSPVLMTVGNSDLTGAFLRINGVGIAAGPASYPAIPPVANYSGTAYTHIGDGGAGLGAGRWFDGSIAEMVLCDHTYCDYLWVEGYLAHKYGIALNSQHPFYAAAPTTGPRQSSGALRAVNIRGGADQ